MPRANAESDKASGSDAGDSSFLQRIVRVRLSREEATVMGRALKSVGLDTAPKLRSFLLKRSGVRALQLLSDAALNVGATAACMLSYASLLSSEQLPRPLALGLAVVPAFGAGWFLVTVSSDIMVLLITTVTAIRLGIDADAFIELVLGPPSEGPRSPVEAASRAQAALRSAGLLDEAMRGLQAKTRAMGAPSTAETLRAFFALQEAEAKGFAPSQLMLTERDGMEAARAFESFDSDSDGALSEPELRRLLERVTGKPCSEEDAHTAMVALDEDGDGKIELKEFARWWSEVQAPPPEQGEGEQKNEPGAQGA